MYSWNLLLIKAVPAQAMKAYIGCKWIALFILSISIRQWSASHSAHFNLQKEPLVANESESPEARQDVLVKSLFPLLGIQLQTVQPTAQSLYQLCHLPPFCYSIATHSIQHVEKSLCNLITFISFSHYSNVGRKYGKIAPPPPPPQPSHTPIPDQQIYKHLPQLHFTNQHVALSKCHLE